MKFKGKRCIANYVKMSVALLGVVGTTLLSNMSAVYAEEIIHTHIWATKFDKEKHWEYCTVCNKKQESKKHEFTDNWKDGKESCWAYNYSVRVCKCGYSYEYHKEHTNITGWHNATNRIYHYKACSDCRAWTISENCKDNEGVINCKNPGTCNTCKVKYTSDAHYIKKDGSCRDCGIKLIKMSKPTVKYASDKSYAEVTVTIESLHKDLKLTGKIDAHTTDNASKKLTWTSVENSDKSMTYTGKYTFNPDVKQEIKFDLQNHHEAFKFNGVPIVSDLNLQSVILSPDNEKPTVKEIKQKDQKIHNSWATIKELTITGTENISNVVSISIKDKQTGDVIVDKAEAEVKEKKYTYMCTPELEGPAEGRTYVLVVEDNIGNKVEKDFVVYKTDCRAPLIRSSKEFVEWSQTKDLSFELTDYGAGTPSTSLKDQVSYKKATKTADKYFAKYVFDEENYGVTEYKLYVKDGLGNAALETIKVGKIDNTKPTVEELKFSLNQMEIVDSLGQGGSKAIGAIITVVANDKNEKLKAEGSGVCGYALTKSKDKPKDEDWKTTDSLEAKEAGKYYLWVKDKAGNMADIHVLNVKEDFSVEIVEKIPVEKEKPKEEPVKEDPKDKGKDKDKDKVKDKDKDENDKTPGTGDSSFVLAAGILLLISFLMGMVVVMKRRTKY